MTLRERGLLFWLAALAGLLMVGGFALLADEVAEGETLGFDQAVLALLRAPGNLTDPLGPPWLEEAARDITALGSFTVLVPLVAVVAIYLMLTNRARTGWFLVAASASGALISTLMKQLFDRPRPDVTAITRVFTSSFPSGHAMASAVVFLTIGTMLASATHRKRERWFFLVVAVVFTLVVGASRVYLGVHYPTDVAAGWLIGAGWAIACALAARVFRG